MAGEPYAAGGIRTTVAATRAATDEQLTAHVARHVAEMRRQGTTTVEIKSGYGLTVLDEARSLAVARQFTEETTFLGRPRRPGRVRRRPGGLRRPGHRSDARGRGAVRPLDRRRSARRGAFDADQARAVLAAGAAAGLRGRLHANQLGPGPGRPARRRARAGRGRPLHLPRRRRRRRARATPAPSRRCCRASSSRPGSPTPTPARLLDAGVRVALASDCNPGSCYTSSMPLCIALAVREMGMTPAEAVHAATAVGARALARDDVGRPGAGHAGRPRAAGRAQPRPPGLPARRTAGGRDLGRRPARSKAPRPPQAI